jgi:hypothetical protein
MEERKKMKMENFCFNVGIGLEKLWRESPNTSLAHLARILEGR